MLLLVAYRLAILRRHFLLFQVWCMPYTAVFVAHSLWDATSGQRSGKFLPRITKISWLNGARLSKIRSVKA
jgi:hypothetical protein